MIRQDQISNQDYNLVKTATEKTTQELGSIYNFSEDSIGFQFLVLSEKFKRSVDEIIIDITDTIFLKKQKGEDSGPDRGVDAIFIDNETDTIHIFNFKFTAKKLENIKNTNFQGGEINNIITFLKDLIEKNRSTFSGNTSNTRLENKVKEIWLEQDKGKIFTIKVHLVSNLFNGLAESEDKRFRDSINDFKGVEFDYILTNDISNILFKRKEKIDGKFKALSKNFFDKSDGGNRAVILEMSAIDLLKITTNNNELRNKIDFEDMEILESDIEEAVFDDNVRVYLKQRTNINKNIKSTALKDEEKNKIFFYNNGITITCNNVDYQNTRNQTITLIDFQIVNGGQTVHALRSAFEENQENFDEITVLCKIFVTNNKEFKSKIAEYTNSQNPVKDRDIRSIDLVQIKLEEEFKQLDYFYERKKNQYEREDRNKKIDAEKLGQSILAFKLEMPAESKNKKSIIFGDKYNDIFNDDLSAAEALEIYNLYLEIENKKIENKDIKPYLLHASYYIMFFIKKIGGMISSYDKALRKIEYIIKKESEKLQDDYTDAVLFKSNRPKEYLAELEL